jgi:trypsin
MERLFNAARHVLAGFPAGSRSRRRLGVGMGALLAAATLLGPAVVLGLGPAVVLGGPALALGSKPGARASIVGGQATPIEAIPFQVALYDPQITPGPGEAANPIQSQFCAGVILDARHVITAGHCVMNQQPHGVAAPQQIEVLAATNNLDTAEDSPGYIEDPVSATSFDPEWEPVSNEHDIGLLTLQNPLWTGSEPVINGTSKVAPIPLASALPSSGSMLTVSGWGYDMELIGEARPSDEEGFQRHLLSIGVPFVPASACANDYRATSDTVAPSTVCAGGNSGQGACFGDSGGPLFEGLSTPDPRLLGIVDFGYGCGEAGFPGIFQSMVDAGNAKFVRSGPPQAPLEQSPPGISGTPLPGQRLTCSPGSWSGNPSYTYSFYVDESSPANPEAHTAITPLSATPTYTVSSANAGQRIFCLARATNAGGYNFDNSPDVTVPGVTAPAGAATRPAPPTLQVVSKNCARMRCVVNVRVSEGTGAAAVSTVRATLSFKRWGTCRHRSSGRLKCLHTLTRTLKAKAIPGYHFVIQTGSLQAGTYELTLVAVDKAGVHQVKATKITLVVRPTKR